MNYSKEWITKQEFQDIINYPDISRRDELIISILYYCALRVSEMAALKVKDIDIENRKLILWKSKKSDDPELVPIPSHLTRQISQWIKEHNKKPDDPLIRSRNGGSLSRSRIYRIIKQNALNAKISKDLTTHSFRSYVAKRIMPRNTKQDKILSSIKLKNHRITHGIILSN